MRAAFIQTCILYGVLIAGLTEGLSLTRSLNFSSVAVFWTSILILNIVFLVFALQQRHRVTKDSFSALLPTKLIAKARRALPQESSQKATIVCVMLILLLCLATALIAPPNNWDSMTYHMPRVMHWLQNGTVAHYTTNNLRQISFPPFAGYTIAQLQLLSGGDRFANTVQWLAFVGSITGISLLTRQLSTEKAARISTLVCASLPMAIMQSTTTQTDLITTFWLVCFAYFIFSTESYSGLDYFWLSASLGLSILTKPTAIIFGFPLVIILALRIFRAKQLTSNGYFISSFLQSIFTVLGLVASSLILSIPSYWRNYETFSSFLGIDGGTRNTNITLLSLIFNILKNLALNLPIPGFLRLVHQLEKQVYSVNNIYQQTGGVNIDKFRTSMAPNEDHVGSPIHLILGVLAAVVLIVTCYSYWRLWKAENRSQRIDRNTTKDNLLWLLSSNLSGFLLFNLLLNWQPWGNRLLLPVFVLNTPVIADYLNSSVKPKLRSILLSLLAISAVLYALTPMRHPLLALPISHPEQSQSILTLDRQAIYFSGVRKDLKVPYEAATDAIVNHGCGSIGLALDMNDWEYPLWTLLHQKSAKPFRLKHVRGGNEYTEIASEFADSALCAVIATIDTNNPQQPLYKQQGWQATTISESPLVRLYLKQKSV